MTEQQRLAMLATLLGARRDMRVAALSRAAAARDAVAERLGALDVSDAGPAGLDPLTAARQSLLHRQWAEAQRITLNRELAARTAAFLAAREAARIDVGRANAIEALVNRRRPRQES